MAKMIKFDLPIDRVKVSTLRDLQDHFTTEVIEHFRSGLLTRWLRARGLDRELAAVEAIRSDDDAHVLKELCRLFKVEADEETIAWAIGVSEAGVPGTQLKNAALVVQLAKRILDLDFDTLWEALSALQRYRPSAISGISALVVGRKGFFTADDSPPIIDLPLDSPVWNFSRFKEEFCDAQEFARELLECLPPTDR